MYTPIPTRVVGPVKMASDVFSGQVRVPLATFEAPLWHSVNRGAKLSRSLGGIKLTLIDDKMTRSILLQATDAAYALKVKRELSEHYEKFGELIAKGSSFTKYQGFHCELVANLIYLRLVFTTGCAAGHNMATKAAQAIQDWLLKTYGGLSYVSISANYCVDKKNSAINGILGRGKRVIAELLIPSKECNQVLKVTPEKLVDLNIKKNLIGSILAGGVRSANAHFANMLLAFYLAIGQDAANLVEGSQGITHAEVCGNDLYFSITLPNIIIGAVGAGKDFPAIKHNLQSLGIDEFGDDSAQYLAIIAAAIVWCGEISLLAAEVIPGQLVRSHLALERKR